ncbi:olfactory receptor 51I2-like [Perognathus longimembris pacificus]|uniref:olfactory receptor 51I2-like n=1 Tax=Perognathus longimembris pacificus TaxID=214514 RepID=UPI0020198076|nr:olfactory receptor 51I2-like [Perognathus longimembris pacificus]
MGMKSNESVDLFSVYLTGIPGLEAQHVWLSIPFFTMYIVAIVGNSLIMAAVQADSALHEPMYLFLSMLAITEVGVSVSTLPTVMGILWFDARRVNFDGCLAQMFFIHTFSGMESGVLLAMSYDRFVAIYNPLRYTAILTLPRIISMGAGITLKSVALMAPLPVLLRQLPYCHINILSHSYCLHSDLIQLPCADTKLNSLLGLSIVLATFGLDSLLIVVSYALILYTVLGIASGEGRKKALNTCVSHICAVLVYYVPMIGVSVMHRVAKHASPMAHTLMSSIYLFVPPVLNPIIYSIKTRPIRQGIVSLFCKKESV